METDAASNLTFRGRIFWPSDGYKPRALLELELRAAVGAILSKRHWWLKWQRDDIRDKWFTELECQWIVDITQRSTSEWRPWWVEDILRHLHALPADATDDEKRAAVASACATIPNNLIWHDEDTRGRINEVTEILAQEPPEAFQQGNAKMESYGQIVWYFALVLLHDRLRAMPIDEYEFPYNFRPGTAQVIAQATEFLLAVHRGDATKESFAQFVPSGDHRPHIVDALWVHVDRIIQEFKDIRQCITKTLEQVIQENKLTEETVTRFVSPGPIEETWMSDSLIHDDLKRKFLGEVAVLENVPDDQKDWHPDSNNQVLDLVHPSLYCCVFGTTKCVPPDTMLPALSAVEHMQRMMFSASNLVENRHRGDAQYQWIPSDFAVSESGDVQIQSYINNLHPVKNRELYDSIAHVFKSFVPMFDRVLSCLTNQHGPRAFMHFDSYSRETYQIPMHSPIPERLDLEPPTPSFTLHGRTVQVITKIAEIHLTPENPTYAGGAWHVEGTDAEQIVATGIYYFGCDNITESKLAFRVIVQEPQYQQDDYVGMRAVYGLANEERLVQPLGAATAIEDRCLVFPNTLQHHVEPFELADKTKPGVRKILAFFIVDPTKRIPSTAEIPPQQTEWIQEALDPVLRHLQHSKTLPGEIMGDNVKAILGPGGMTLDQAKQFREELMDERSPGGDDDDDNYELFFSLCEH